MAIIWFLIIAYIIYIAYKSNNKVEQTNKNINDITRARPTNSNNSYYTSDKVNSYRKMNQDHVAHEDIKDITDSIGYKRCPNCEATVSKKSDTCFMCDYEFNDSSK